jgi:predicted negative regulator of RcsB-dependent stress response
MQLQDAPVNYFFKVWPWIEANKIRLIWGGGIVAVAVALVAFSIQRRAQREIDAGIAFTQAIMTESRDNGAEKQAAEFMKVAVDYAGTAAAQRAILQSAAIMFGAHKYPEAQAQFEQFLSQYSGSTLASQAALGVASCLDAQGKTDQAAGAYQRVINNYYDSVPALFARYRLAEIFEQQDKITDAMNLYEDIARTSPGSGLASQAGLRAMELKTRPEPGATNPTPAAPFKLSP